MKKENRKVSEGKQRSGTARGRKQVSSALINNLWSGSSFMVWHEVGKKLLQFSSSNHRWAMAHRRFGYAAITGFSKQIYKFGNTGRFSHCID